MEYENTRIYETAVELVELSHRVAAGLPRGNGYLVDQLNRASSSVLLNFAEGYGKPTKNDQRRFFCYSIGSANEIAAIFDVANIRGSIAAQKHSRGKELCDHLARMLARFR